MWSVVARFATLGEAASARSALAAAGIESRVADENTIAVDWLYSNALGGIKLLVRDESVDEAADILSVAAHEPTSEDADDHVMNAGHDADQGLAAAATGADDLVNTRLCPYCGRGDAQRIPRLELFLALAVVGYGVGVAVNEPALALALIMAVGLIVAATPSHRCGACGERWDAGAEPEQVAGAPEPEAAERSEAACPRCGSREFYRITYRRLKAAPLIAPLLIVFFLPIWLMMPKWKCDDCGLRAWRQ